jgi:hypothetical protein
MSAITVIPGDAESIRFSRAKSRADVNFVPASAFSSPAKGGDRFLIGVRATFSFRAESPRMKSSSRTSQ